MTSKNLTTLTWQMGKKRIGPFKTTHKNTEGTEGLIHRVTLGLPSSKLLERSGHGLSHLQYIILLGYAGLCWITFQESDGRTTNQAGLGFSPP